MASYEVSLLRSSVVGRAWKYAAMSVQNESFSKLKLKFHRTGTVCLEIPNTLLGEALSPEHPSGGGSESD